MIKNARPSRRSAERFDGFDAFWGKLTAELRTQRKIRSWTREKGDFGEDFEALYVGGIYVRCVEPSARFFPSYVSEESFRIVYGGWQDYVEGRTNRYYLLKSPYVKYIISIFHQYEKEMRNKATSAP